MGNFKYKIANFFVKFPPGGNFMIRILQLENRKREVNAISPKSNTGKLRLRVD